MSTCPKGCSTPTISPSGPACWNAPTPCRPSKVAPGEPPWDDAQLRLDGLELEQPATSHFVIIDGEGNIASVTASIESAFGSRLMAAGFLLNNQLTDFSFRADMDGEAVANRVDGGKRPRSSMSPTIVPAGWPAPPCAGLARRRDDHSLSSRAPSSRLSIGEMDMQQAISMPHMVNMFGDYVLGKGRGEQRQKRPPPCSKCPSSASLSAR